MRSAILLWHFCRYWAPPVAVLCAVFWCSRRVHVILCRAVQCIVIIIISSSSNWITASRYSSIVELANILKEIVGRRRWSLNPTRRGLNSDVRPAPAFYWRRMPIHTSSRVGGGGNRTAAGPARSGQATRDRERPVSEDGRTEARGSLSTYNNERRWQKLGSDDDDGDGE